MSIGTNYAHPVSVNGYSCNNCTDVDYAKKHIDPAHPKSGPYGVNAASDPGNPDFVLGGALANAQALSGSVAVDPKTAGLRLNIQV